MPDEFSLAALARAVWHRRKLVAVIVVACVAASAIITLVLPKIYRAETSVFFPTPTTPEISAALGQVANVVPGLGALAPSPGAASLCKAIAESYSVRAEIARQFHLERFFKTTNFQDATDELRDSTWTAITPEGLLLIRVDTVDPRLAADLANAYARIVERVYRDSTVSRARGEREFLEQREAQAAKDLDRAQAELERYQRRGAALLAPDEVSPILQKLSDVRVEQAEAQVELEAAERRRGEAIAQLNLLASGGGAKEGGGSLYAIPWENSTETMSDNPDIAKIRADLVSLEVQLAAARHDLSDQHPDVKRLQSQIEETKKRLEQEARKTITEETRTRSPVYASALEQLVGLETAAIGQAARVEGLGALVRQVETQANALPAQLLAYSQLEREVRAKEQVYITLDTQLEAARLKELQEQPVFQVLDVAVPPERYDRPKLGVNMMVGFLFGVFLGMAIAAAKGPAKTKSAA